jgi:hypothetical protein
VNEPEGPIPARLGKEMPGQIDEVVQVVVFQILSRRIVRPEND